MAIMVNFGRRTLMKKILPLLLSLTLVFGTFSMAFAATPTDVKDTDYQEAVEALMELGIVNGYTDGTYQPEKPVTRAEMAKFIIASLEMDDDGILLYSGGFTDVGSKNWARGYIGYANHLGIITGYSDKTFKPNQTVSYDEAITMIIRALGYNNDVLKGTWPKNYVEKAKELGIITDEKQGKKGANRGDIALMLNEAVDQTIGAVSDGEWVPFEDDTMKNRLTTEEENLQPGKIPYGSRLIHEYGLDGAVTDSTEDIIPSKYYEQPPIYQATSNDNLTILTNFKTTQQTTSWTCGPTSALMVLEWFGKRGDLNELDLASIRGKDFGGATNLKQMMNIFDGLEKKLGQKWNVVSSYDLYEDEDGYYMLKVEKDKALYLQEAISYYLEKGIPMIVGWQDWAGHYQVIIGYDNMGTEVTQDDVLIFADPYDTTDHKQGGYLIQSYERFIYDWSVSFDPDFDSCIFLVASPEGYTYKAPAKGVGITEDRTNIGKFTNDNMIAFGDKLPQQLEEFAKDYAFEVWLDENGLGGPAASTYFRAGDHNYSPYYKYVDAYNLKDTKSLQVLENFKTIQQATEYTCGVTSMLMTLEWFGKRGDLTEIDLANKREKTDDLPGTNVKEMLNVIKNLDTKWKVKSSYDLVDGDSLMECGIKADGKYMDLADMIPYYVSKNIPVMIMWHEWGGHWQVIIGYDDMGTEGTQDDVLILADPYDTTDHNQNGYVIESYERFIYDWGNTYDPDMEWGAFIVMEPAN